MFDVEHIIAHIRRAADPARAVHAKWPPALAEAQAITLIAAGKAAHTMAAAALEHCAGRVVGGAVAAREALTAPVPVYPAAHPFPDERNLTASRAIAGAARPLSTGDTLLLLLSGGGSAMMAYPVEGITLGDLQTVTRALMHAGASIDELNTVRKHCEVLKGGGLARLAHPARVVALILSDVVGDRLDVIASGPVTADPTTPADALDVLRRYTLLEEAPPVTRHLQTAEPPTGPMAHVETHIVGSNQDALRAAEEALTAQGFEVTGTVEEVTGEAREVGQRLAEEVRSLRTGQAVLYGGETTVTVTGGGSGGRNQEVALSAALSLEGADGVRVMTFATDGVDGPTDAAGAVISGHTVERIRQAGTDPQKALQDNDSHTALAAADALIRTGPTGTNVNDVALGVRLP
jgi:hydroxypyruvate reductase